MEKYNYRKIIKEDIKNYILENYDIEDLNYDDLYDELFIGDSVTGNGSGSYTFSTYKAEENLCHNLKLLKEACDCFGCNADLENAEACDVTIRCYLLGECLTEVLDEIKEKL